MKKERIEKLEGLLKCMIEQFVILISNNNKLLEENIRLLKENDELKDKK